MEEGDARARGRGELQIYAQVSLTFAHVEKMSTGQISRKKVSTQRPWATVGENQGFRGLERTHMTTGLCVI